MKIILTLVAFMTLSLNVAATSLDKIVVFGDSLSDNGNLYEYMKHQLPLSPPYYEGRFTNGPVWVELLAERYFGDKASSHLLDYAFGGAGVEGEDADLDDDSLFTLRREVDSYLLAHQDKADDHSLYVMWMGSNNYLAMPDEVSKAVADVNWGIKASLERLIQKGARYFLIINSPDLSITPTARDFDAVQLFDEYSTQHNDTLKKTIDELKQTHPEVKWVSFDVYKTLHEVLLSPEQYGFTNVSDTCYELVDNNPPTLKSSQSILAMVAKVRKRISKDACDGYLFFDPVHPSGAAHRVLAARIMEMLGQEHIVFDAR